MEWVVTPCGVVRMIYDETIDVHSIGIVTIRRGSHVEPTEDGQWTVDLSPVNGPVCGPYRHRSEAIAFEIDWLRQHWLSSPKD